jgi:hypothetical protein
MQYRKALTSLTLAASLLTDPSIASKYIGVPPGAYFAVVVCLVLYQIIFLLSRRGFRVHPKVIFLGAAFFIYGIISLTYRFMAGQSAGDFSLHILMIANFYFLLLLITDEGWGDAFVKAIYIAGISHFLSLLPDPLGFRGNLIAATAYSLGDGGLSEIFRRETGLFPAPAMLVAFAVVFFITAFLEFTRGHRQLSSLVLIAMAMVLGLSTFNRSFLVVIAFSLLVLNWCTGMRIRLLVLYAIGASTMLILPMGEYVEFVGNRVVTLLIGGLDATQRWNGDTGIVTGFNIFLEHLFFGSPVAPNGGTLQALGEQQQKVNPHNGLVLILAVYGIIGGAPILVFYGLSIMRVMHVLIKREDCRRHLQRAQNLAQTQTFFAIISISLIVLLMIEPLSEYAFIYLLSISPIIARLPLFSVS